MWITWKKKKKKLHHQKDKHRNVGGQEKDEDEMKNVWKIENFILVKRERSKGSIVKNVRPNIFRNRKKKAKFMLEKSEVRLDHVKELAPDTTGPQRGYSSGGDQQFIDDETGEDREREKDKNRVPVEVISYWLRAKEDIESKIDKNRVPVEVISYWLRTKEDIESKIDRWKATFTSSDSNGQIDGKETNTKPSDRTKKRLKKVQFDSAIAVIEFDAAAPPCGYYSGSDEVFSHSIYSSVKDSFSESNSNSRTRTERRARKSRANISSNSEKFNSTGEQSNDLPPMDNYLNIGNDDDLKKSEAETADPQLPVDPSGNVAKEPANSNFLQIDISSESCSNVKATGSGGCSKNLRQKRKLRSSTNHSDRSSSRESSPDTCGIQLPRKRRLRSTLRTNSNQNE